MVATLALVVALGGTSYAALRIGSPQIVNNSVRSKDLRNGTILGRDVRNRSLNGREIEPGSIGGVQVDEARLAPVPNSLRFQGRVLSELIVDCPGSARATGAICVEQTPRAAMTFDAADAQCENVRGRLPLLVELLNSAYDPVTPEWTANVLSVGAEGLTTVIYGGSTITSSATSVSRPYRCVFPLSNE
ncbi:MAG: hypothetical protein JW895_01545 [Thermoleophilaceae bacterium]|nr:hypothetical protein [Thermoleophilaceae bacterium]